MDIEIIYDEKKYEILKNYREAYNLEEIQKRYTEYFEPFDYIVGDWAYGKLRLKGFYKENNKNSRDLNNYKYVDNYLKNNCSNDCRYFILEKK